MNKKYLLVLMLVLSVLCVGCGEKDDVQNQIEPDNNVVESGEEVNNPSVEIIEEDDKVVINMFDDSTSEYIFSGDTIVGKIDTYYFETEEKAQSFANSLENMNGVTIDGKNVILTSDDSSYSGLTRKDLVETYTNLKEEYENE